MGTILYLLLYAAIGAIGLVGSLLLFLILLDVWRIFRFRISSGSVVSLEKNSAVQQQYYEDIAQPSKKLTRWEERARERQYWRYFYKGGLSTAKLYAFYYLRYTKDAFFNQRWASRVLWRAWCRLALESSGAVQNEALNTAKNQYDNSLYDLLEKDLPLFLQLFSEDQRPPRALKWAEANIGPNNQRAGARRILEKLFVEKTDIGARAGFLLLESYTEQKDYLKAFALLRRYLAHPNATEKETAKSKIKALFSPVIWDLSRWGKSSYVQLRGAQSATFSLSPLSFDKIDADQWMRDPSGPLYKAPAGDEKLKGTLKLYRIPFSREAYGFFTLPTPRGAFALHIEATPLPFPEWKECFGDEPLYNGVFDQRLQSSRMDAVLSLTEKGALCWVVDKKTRAPIPEQEVVFYSRNLSDPQPKEYLVKTDANGLATLSDISFWQVGALVQRPGEEGSTEAIFLTHNQDISTSVTSQDLERIYLYLARPLYKPGETIQGKLIARFKGAEGVSRKSHPGRSFRMMMRGPRGNRITSLHLTLSRFGSAAFSFTLPADAALGKYTFAHEQYAPGSVIEGSFYVEEYVAPEFRSSLTTKEPARWGEPATLCFEASYFFGGPVANAKGTIEITRRPWRYAGTYSFPPPKSFAKDKKLAPLSFQTDAQGKAEITLPWKGPFDLFGRKDGCDFSLKASLRDASGKTCEATLLLSVGRESCQVEVTPIDTLRLPGESLPLQLKWHGEDLTDNTPRELLLTFSRGLRRQTVSLTVSPSQTEASASLSLTPGEWRMRSRLTHQRKIPQWPQTVWVLGEAFPAQRYPVVLFSKQSAKEGETVRVALLGEQAKTGAKILFQHNSGPRLGGIVASCQKNVAWTDLTIERGAAPAFHVSCWYINEDGILSFSQRQITISESEPAPLPPSPELLLSFPSKTLAPGAETTLSAHLSQTSTGTSELICSVVDEALFSLVPAPKDPLRFFEEDPPRAANRPAWTANSASAQHGRTPPYSVPPEPALQSVPSVKMADEEEFGGALYEMAAPMPGAPSMGAVMPQSAPMPMASAAPLARNTAAMPMPASRAAGGFSLSLPSLDLSGLMSKKSSGPAPEQPKGGGAPPVEITLRSDFSSEAAWHPSVLLQGREITQLPVKFSDSLTTWRASALVLTVDDRVGRAETTVKTQKPLMVRLQAPRFFQERDSFTLLALLDSRAESEQKIHATIEASLLSLQSPNEVSLTLPAGGQAKVETKAVVPACQEKEISVWAKAIHEDDPETHDAEERTMPYRPYGIERISSLRGVLSTEAEEILVVLPKERRPEYTALSLQLDRGPLDAVLQALAYLREYPYGCVEQTCSRLIPNLVWERVQKAHYQRSAVADPPYRSVLSTDFIRETIQRLTSMQNSDGGFGWWPNGYSDFWMTAYIVFSFSLAEQRLEADKKERACRYLTQNLLNLSNRDDADAFGIFALSWAGYPVGERPIEVMLSRWDSLSLSERAKFCWVLSKREHQEAASRLREVCKALAPDAKKLVKEVARGEVKHPLWFRPAATEGISFLVLALLQAEERESTPSEELQLFVSFLLLHREGGRWHSTRDTALAVLALLHYEERFGAKSADASLRVLVNEEQKVEAKLGGLTSLPPMIELYDDDLRSGENQLTLITKGIDSASIAQPRHYSITLRHFSTEENISPHQNGLFVERSYWLLNELQKPIKELSSGDTIEIGQRLRVVLKVKADKAKSYILLEDPKLAGCEPLAKKSGPEVCQGKCAHVELRTDRTAIFLDHLTEKEQTLSYEIEAQLPGTFYAMPARAETMYESECEGSSASFCLTIVQES